MVRYFHVRPRLLRLVRVLLWDLMLTRFQPRIYNIGEPLKARIENTDPPNIHVGLDRQDQKHKSAFQVRARSHVHRLAVNDVAR